MTRPLDVAALKRFIDTEFRARFRSVIDQITLPIPNRVDQFTCWPGLEVVHSDADSGRLTLRFKTNPSKLRTGEYIYVNPLEVLPKDVISGPEGIIESINEKDQTLIIKPGFRQDSRFGARFRIQDRLVLDQTLPGARFSREMPVLALRLLAGEMGDTQRTSHIRALLEGPIQRRDTGQSYDESTIKTELGIELNEAQHEAVKRGLESDLALIQGPPGTGKTFVLGLLIREFVKRGLKVAVCAFTHQAINNVMMECLRYEEIEEVCKVGSRNSWRAERNLPRLRLIERAGAYFRSKKTPPVTGFTQHAAFQPIAKDLGQGEALSLPDRFDVIVFDESGQLTIPAALMAMFQADRYVFAGDHKQLPPVVATRHAGGSEGQSIFQHFVETLGEEPVLLNRSFRLNDQLCEFPSQAYYDGKLLPAAIAQDRRLDIDTTKLGEFAPLLDPKESLQLALVKHRGRGQESPEEAALVATLVDTAIRAGVPAEEIAVIAPHRRQNVKIREYLAKLGHSGHHPLIDTVERIQGQERDLVFLSMTLSDPDVLAREADFLFLPNRFNVATTRARMKLVVVASQQFFRTLPRAEALNASGSKTLSHINVLKRWYFERRPKAVDATDLAQCALKKLE